MACPQGTKIYAALAGTVSAAGYNASYGNYVKLFHHSDYEPLYAHQKQKASVTAGQSVSTYTVLGYVGSTGQSSEPHLHFCVFKTGGLSIRRVYLTQRVMGTEVMGTVR